MSLCALLLVLASSGCKPQSAKGMGPVDAGPMVVGPENVTTAKQGLIQTGPRISGSLEPKQQARVRSEVSGSVLSVQADVGQAVQEGQVLAHIEDRALRDAFQSAQSAVQSARTDEQVASRQVERTERLVQAGALAERDLEAARSTASAAKARVAQARAQLAQMQKQLESATVKSPMPGIVSERAVNAGDVVAPGAALFTIIDPSSMRLTASVPSDSLSALSVGAPVQFTVRGYPNQTFTGQIERIAPAADPVTRQITVLVAIPNESGRLISGLFAEGRVNAVSRQAITIPLTAVEINGDKATVTAVRDGRVEQVPVQLGVRDDQAERVEIVSGVRPGETLLVGAAKTLAPGTPVRVSGASGQAEREG